MVPLGHAAIVYLVRLHIILLLYCTTKYVD